MLCTVVSVIMLARLYLFICSYVMGTSFQATTLQAAAAAGLHPGAAQPHMSDGSGSEPEADEEMAEAPAEGASMEQVQREVQQKQAAFEAAQGVQVPGKGAGGDRGGVAGHHCRLACHGGCPAGAAGGAGAAGRGLRCLGRR